MAPSKRRKTPAVSDNASAGVQNRCSASARGDPPDAPDADLDAEDDGTRTFDDEGDVGVLRTWRAMCPELQARGRRMSNRMTGKG